MRSEDCECVQGGLALEVSLIYRAEELKRGGDSATITSGTWSESEVSTALDINLTTFAIALMTAN